MDSERILLKTAAFYTGHTNPQLFLPHVKYIQEAVLLESYI